MFFFTIYFVYPHRKLMCKTLLFCTMACQRTPALFNQSIIINIFAKNLVKVVETCLNHREHRK